MQPEILVMAPSPSPAVMAQLDEHFTCHHLWQVLADQHDAFIDRVGAGVRGLATTGTIGIDAALAARLPALEIVAVNGIGVDAVDFAATRPRGIAVTNTPGVLTDDVADLAVALLLAAARRIPALDHYVRGGQWAERVPLQPARTLRGKTAGIYGFGRIGRAVAARLAGFGLELRYWQPNVVAGTGVPRSASLADLARESDYLVVCAPGGPATRGLVDAAVLAALGPQGTLINIARGSIVDEPALVAALADGSLGAAGLDVFASEPDVPPALAALPNVVLTPHVGSLTVETRHAMGQLVVDNLLAHFLGRALLTPVP
ncbi:2-hydroxyacid dehydrogenase [Pseudoduganella buxea]|uniref:2-hydroxyacid dehydrogenase n=1 Tax=Pseudoduganella buxea TaxID=1949069 RepID=A0A6I3T0V2_9BURK|nr:2-hydroxyacid dehydrogenase [Pseudoduganella buxea]MTV55063.1 2-hydroxyacid dehydrogenase [Pseudoduganella buxea]GGC13967.1 dihydrofolate reductase [Pseudoduganella buxea]